MQDAVVSKEKAAVLHTHRDMNLQAVPPFDITLWIILLPLLNPVTLRSAPVLRFMTMDL